MPGEQLLNHHGNTLVLCEEPALFGRLSQEFHRSSPHPSSPQFTALLSHLLQPVSESWPPPQASANFSFLSEKIVRTQTKWHLNRILCALNAGSHLFSLTCGSHAPEPHSYQMEQPSLLLKYEFNARRRPFCSSVLASLGEL